MEKNSFYDVHQRQYSAEELKLYRDLVGMPLYGSYEQLIDSLNKEIIKDATSSDKRIRNKQNIKRSKHNVTSN